MTLIRNRMTQRPLVGFCVALSYTPTLETERVRRLARPAVPFRPRDPPPDKPASPFWPARPSPAARGPARYIPESGLFPPPWDRRIHAPPFRPAWLKLET